VATTSSGGADSWRDRFADLLTSPCYRIPANVLPVDSRCVIVMPDSDEAGLKYKNDVIASLNKRQIPHCVVTFDGFKDVSEYLDAGHTAEELAHRITDEITEINGQGDVIYPRPPEVSDDVSI